MVGVGFKFKVGPVPYVVAEMLNEGGFATVYRADPMDAASGSPPLAVKVPKPDVLGDEVWLRKFRREARILSNITHKNVVRIVGLIEWNNDIALVQEYIASATELGDYFAVPGAKILSTVLQVLYGLRATHGTSPETRTVHRDLNPRNVLVDDTGVARIIDFGLAKEEERKTTVLTRRGDWFGTRGCMAPEQYTDAANVDHRADLYALGRTVAAAIQQRHPEHANPGEIVGPWGPICAQLTAYKPESRFPDAESVVDRILHDFLGAGELPESMPLHVAEFNTWGKPPAAWARVLRKYFDAQTALDEVALETAKTLTDAILDDGHFDRDSFFLRLLTEVIQPFVDRGPQAYEMYAEADRYSHILHSWFPHLAPDQQAAAFQFLVRAAVRFHRYSLMDEVRSTFRSVSDPTHRQRLLAILEQEDPNKTIYGWGSIPR